jgi:hypothetical protein
MKLTATSGRSGLTLVELTQRLAEARTGLEIIGSKFLIFALEPKAARDLFRVNNRWPACGCEECGGVVYVVHRIPQNTVVRNRVIRDVPRRRPM